MKTKSPKLKVKIILTLTRTWNQTHKQEMELNKTAASGPSLRYWLPFQILPFILSICQNIFIVWCFGAHSLYFRTKGLQSFRWYLYLFLSLCLYQCLCQCHHRHHHSKLLRYIEWPAIRPLLSVPSHSFGAIMTSVKFPDLMFSLCFRKTTTTRRRDAHSMMVYSFSSTVDDATARRRPTLNRIFQTCPMGK